MSDRAVQVRARGRVQGVAFRWHTAEQAKRLGVRGWVRNLDDGSVQAWLEGAAEQVESLVRWMRSGPPAARVDALEAQDASARGLVGFEVRTDGAAR